MKPFPLTLSLAAALAAMPAMAQYNAYYPKPVKFEIGDQDADLGLALVALDNGTIPFLGDLILSNATVIVLTKRDTSFVYDADLPMQCDADLWWQGVTWDAVDGIKILPIQKLAVDLAVDKGFDDAAKADAANADAAKADERAPAQEPLPIELSFLPADDGTPGSVLQAKLIAPTSDYNLVLVRVDTLGADGKRADVYLYGKVPGEGEGMLDVIEEHTVTVDMAGAKTVRVFLATGTKSRPGVATAWVLLTKLAR